MTIVFTGDNSFEIDRAVRSLVRAFTGDAEHYDGEALTLSQLPDLFMGGTLFAPTRLVVIKGLTANKALWTELPHWLERMSDDVQLVLVEPAFDKRTKTAKVLQKQAEVREFKQWTDRDRATAVAWVREEMTRLGGTIEAQLAQLLVDRVGLDQWALFHALEKLVVLDAVTPGVLTATIDATPTENVFGLFEAALQGRGEEVQRMIATLSLSEDPYRLFGLLSGQAFHLAVLASTDIAYTQVASDIKAHPFALQKLAPHAKRLGVTGARHVVGAFVLADTDMKRSGADPWLLIERALLQVARRET